MGPLLLLAALLVPQGEAVVLTDVTLIDVEAASAAEARQPGRTVILAGDRIRWIGPAGDADLPEGATVIDGGRKFLIPGLFDMHVHLAGQGDGALVALVAHGVTSARDLGGDLELLDATLARVEAGDLVGPRVARAGYVIEDRSWLDRVLGLYAARGEGEYLRRTRIGVRTEDDVLEAVARVAESGAEVLKFRNTPNAEVFRFLMDEARLAGLRVAGHEPNTVDLLEAVSLGIGSLEHLPIRASMGGTGPERWRKICAAMVEHGVHVTPTFVAMENRRMTADELEAALEVEREDPRWPTLTPELVEAWDGQLAERRDENDTVDWKELDLLGTNAVRGMHDAGVRFLAGTDLGVAFVYPGSSLHEELVLLVERAGLTPLEALAAATTNAAAWLGWEDLGALREGYRADLVLLDADPLVDVASVARIHTVVSRGLSYGPAQRERMMGDVIAANGR